MLGSTYPDASGGALPPKDGAELFAEVAPVLQRADLTFGNLEAPLFDGGTRPHCTPGAIAEHRFKNPGSNSCWAFRTPERYGKHLQAAGFDVLSLANNHVDDFGPAGRAATVRVLDNLGIAHSGATGTVAKLTVRGAPKNVSVHVIAFATDAGQNDMDDLTAAKRLVAQSAREAVVIVSFHGGAEGPSARPTPAGAELFHGQNRGAPRPFAHAVIDAGADLVLGHGPHVLRGLEVYEGRLIAYSLGSFVTYKGISIQGVRGQTMVLQVRLAPDGRFLDGKAIAVRQRRPQGPRLDDSAALVTDLQRLSRADFGQAAPAFQPDGALRPPRPPE